MCGFGNYHDYQKVIIRLKSAGQVFAPRFELPNRGKLITTSW